MTSLGFPSTQLWRSGDAGLGSDWGERPRPLSSFLRRVDSRTIQTARFRLVVCAGRVHSAKRPRTTVPRPICVAYRTPAVAE